MTLQKMTNSGFLRSNDKSLKGHAINLKMTFSTHLTVEDMENAEKAIFAFEQQQHFTLDIALLEKGNHCWKDSPMSEMDSILDQGILRVGGRINRSAMPVSVKNPKILPKKSHISEIILRDIQTKSYALKITGCPLKTLWKIIRNCVVCRWMQMADLSLTISVGMDYFGPFEIKRGRTSVKWWV